MIASTRPGDMPAAPVPGDFCYLGLTKREYFAGQILAAMLTPCDGDNGWSEPVQRAVKYADTLIATLEGTGT